MSTKTIFLDRDGVINKEINYLYKVEDFEFIEGVFESCIYFQSLGYQIIIITNQSGIARRYYSKDNFIELTNWMIRQFNNKGIDILDVFYCPHKVNSDCECRKPKPGMLIQAKKKYGINLENSWMIGDKEIDIEAANSAGIRKTILVRSGHHIDEESSNAQFICNSINQASLIITE